MKQPKADRLEFPPLAARSIKDFRVPDDAINPDPELGKRTDQSAMELLRLSLLGIAGYGFLLKEMAMGNSAGLAACQEHHIWLLAGAGLLAITASAALMTREWLVRCSWIQIMILRTFVKLENDGWADSEKSQLRESIHLFRAEQKMKLTWSKYGLRTAHICLSFGAIVTVVSFGLVLLALQPEPKKQGSSLPQPVFKMEKGSSLRGGKPVVSV